MPQAERLIHQPQPGAEYEFDLVQAQANGRDALNEMYNIAPWNDGALLESVSLTTGANAVEHTLDRPPRGWRLVLDSATPAKFHAYLDSAIAGGAVDVTYSTVVHDTEYYDFTNNHASGIFTAPHTGLYEFHGSAYCATVADGTLFFVRFLLSGDSKGHGTSQVMVGGSVTPGLDASAKVKLTAGDTVRLQIYQNSGGNKNMIADDANNVYNEFQGEALLGLSDYQAGSSDTSKFLQLYSDCDRTATLWVF